MKQLDKHFDKQLVDEFVNLLADPRFQGVELPAIRAHVPYLTNITLSELKAACRWSRSVLGQRDEPSETHRPLFFESTTASKKATDTDTKELRHFFLEVLSTIYNHQLETGELDGRDGFVSYSLLQSIDFTSSDVDKGLPLNDWTATQVTDKFFSRLFVESGWNAWQKVNNIKYCCSNSDRVGDDRAHTFECKKLKVQVLRAISFIEAHRQARKIITDALSDSNEIDPIEQIVLDESIAETDKAQKDLDSVD